MALLSVYNVIIVIILILAFVALILNYSYIDKECVSANYFWVTVVVLMFVVWGLIYSVAMLAAQITRCQGVGMTLGVTFLLIVIVHLLVCDAETYWDRLPECEFRETLRGVNLIVLILLGLLFLFALIYLAYRAYWGLF